MSNSMFCCFKSLDAHDRIMAESNFASSFLKDVGLSQYSTRFLEQGYEHFIDLALIDSKDLGYLICDQEHRNVILQAVDELGVAGWLRHYNLDCYIDGFQHQNIQTIKSLKTIKLDDSLLDRLKIKVPGHRKRLCTCVQLLQTIAKSESIIEEKPRQLAQVQGAQEENPKELAQVQGAQEEKPKQLAQVQGAQEEKPRQLAQVQGAQEEKPRQLAQVQGAQEEKPKQLAQVQGAQAANERELLLHPNTVALGYWNRPSILEKLSHDFLCVQGYLKAAPEDLKRSDRLEFLVDSASDVITAREEVITSMGLEFLNS